MFGRDHKNISKIGWENSNFGFRNVREIWWKCLAEIIKIWVKLDEKIAILGFEMLGKFDENVFQRS